MHSQIEHKVALIAPTLAELFAQIATHRNTIIEHLLRLGNSYLRSLGYKNTLQLTDLVSTVIQKYQEIDTSKSDINLLNFFYLYQQTIRLLRATNKILQYQNKSISITPTIANFATNNECNTRLYNDYILNYIETIKTVTTKLLAIADELQKESDSNVTIDIEGNPLFRQYLQFIKDRKLTMSKLTSETCQNTGKIIQEIASKTPDRNDLLTNNHLLSNINQIERLKQGGCATILKGRYNNFPIAIKKSKNKGDLAPEYEIWKKLQHPNIIQIYGYLKDRNGEYIIMPLVANGSVLTVLLSHIMVPIEQTTMWSLQIAQALRYLHQLNPPIIHGDVKPDNVLINANGNALLTDFGHAIITDQSICYRTCGTLLYAAPECYPFEQAPIDVKRDIYSWAITVWQLFSPEHFLPFKEIYTDGDLSLSDTLEFGYILYQEENNNITEKDSPIVYFIKNGTGYTCKIVTSNPDKTSQYSIPREEYWQKEVELSSRLKYTPEEFKKEKRYLARLLLTLTGVSDELKPLRNSNAAYSYFFKQISPPNNKRPTLPKEMPQNLQNLVTTAWSSDSNERPTSDELVTKITANTF